MIEVEIYMVNGIKDIINFHGNDETVEGIREIIHRALDNSSLFYLHIVGASTYMKCNIIKINVSEK